MPRKVVAVVPRLLSNDIKNTTRCGSCQSENPTLPICTQCGHLQDVPLKINYFEAFQMVPTLKIDLKILQQKFHEFSRLTHPDKYVLKSGQEPLFATRWSSLINKAYRQLRDPKQRARYLLEISGVIEPKTIPLELAELYFDIQDKLGTPEGKALLSSFKAQIEKEQKDVQSEWQSLEEVWDASPKNIDRLQKLIVKDKYLSSMLSDINKKGEDFGAHSGN